MSGKMDIKTKKVIREALLQHLYSHLFFRQGGQSSPWEDITKEFFPDVREISGEYFAIMLNDLVARTGDMEAVVADKFKGDFNELNLIDRALVILCVYELTVRGEDKKLVISEGLRLCDKYASPKFDKKLHAFLDSMA